MYKTENFNSSIYDVYSEDELDKLPKDTRRLTLLKMPKDHTKIEAFEGLEILDVSDLNLTKLVLNNKNLKHLIIKNNPDLVYFDVNPNLESVDMSYTNVPFRIFVKYPLLRDIKYNMPKENISNSFNPIIPLFTYKDSFSKLLIFNQLLNLTSFEHKYSCIECKTTNILLSRYFKRIERLSLTLNSKKQIQLVIKDDLETLIFLDIIAMFPHKIECPKLNILEIASNDIDIKNYINCRLLESLSISGSNNNELKNIKQIKQLSKLKILKLDGLDLIEEYIFENDLKELFLNLKRNGLAYKYKKEMFINLNTLTKLSVVDGELDNDIYEYLNELRELTINGCNINNVIFRLNKLTKLELSNLEIKDIKEILSELYSLDDLSLHYVDSYLEFDDSNIPNLSKITRLSVKSKNKSFSFVSLKCIKYLFLDAIYFDYKIRNLNSLLYLSIKFNFPFDMDIMSNMFLKLENLETLEIYGNVNIKKEMFKGLNNLKYLFLYSVCIVECDAFKYLTSLEVINISEDSKYPNGLLEQILKYNRNIFCKIC